MCTKICKICKIEKKCDEFHKMKKAVNGVRTVCKQCRKIEKKEYSSRPEVKEKAKKFYRENKDHIRKKMSLHYWTLNGQFHNYKKRAKIAKLDFELSQEDCKKFYKTNCHYCGDQLKALGIDRKDNNVGYIKDNIVPCCSKCNYMKGIMNEKEFFKQIEKISQNCNSCNL